MPAELSPVPAHLKGWNYMAGYGSSEIWGLDDDRVLVDGITKQITFRYRI